MNWWQFSIQDLISPLDNSNKELIFNICFINTINNSAYFCQRRKYLISLLELQNILIPELIICLLEVEIPLYISATFDRLGFTILHF